MADGSIGIWIGNDLDVGLQLRWGWRLARARQLDLVVFEHVQNNEDKVVETDLKQAADAGSSTLATEVQNLIQSSDTLCVFTPDDEGEVESESTDEQPLTIQLKQIHSATPRAFRELMISEVQQNKLKVLTLARREHDSKDPDVVSARRQFLRYAPCEVVFCYGIVEDREDLKITVAAASGNHGSAAIRLARDNESTELFAVSLALVLVLIFVFMVFPLRLCL